MTRLDAHAKASPTTGDAVAKLYLGLDGVDHQYPTTYLVSKKGCGGSTATTGIDGAARTATTRLHTCTLERVSAHPSSKEEPAEKFACAINTIAHEWTHSIPESSNAGVWLYQDKGHAHSTEGLVSYTVGAIAQCAYLDTRGFRVEEKFDECVKLVGTTAFNPRTCETGSAGVQGWAEKTFGRR